jgi:hypothetical protein
MKGGNTDQLYKDNGRLLMAQSLQEQHPDIVTITEKWGRAQHHVDYSRFRKNKLITRDGVLISKSDEYNLELVENYGKERLDQIDNQLESEDVDMSTCQ